MPALNFNGQKDFIVSLPNFTNVFFDSSLSYSYIKSNVALIKGLISEKRKHAESNSVIVILKKPKRDKIDVIVINITLFLNLQISLADSGVLQHGDNNISAYLHHYIESATGVGYLALNMKRLKELSGLYNHAAGEYQNLLKTIS